MASFMFLIVRCTENTRYAYKVPRMILLRDLNGGVCLECSRDMSVHVSTYTSNDFNTLTPVVWKLWHS